MKKIVSLILSLVMLMSITSGLNLTAYADDVNHYLDFQAEIYSSETAGFDNILSVLIRVLFQEHFIIT